MIMRSHPKECYNILMEAAAGALRMLAKEPKYIGSSKPSMMAVLHTWGRDLSYNPHVHFVVAGGALSDDGTRWLPSNVNYLFPVFALSKVLPSGFRKVRHYGLASARSEMDVELLKWLVYHTADGLCHHDRCANGDCQTVCQVSSLRRALETIHYHVSINHRLRHELDKRC